MLPQIARRRLEEIGQPEQSLVPSEWLAWLPKYFPAYTTYGFAPEHERFWNHVWAIEPGLRPHPFVAIWPRGWAKSTSLEMAVTALGAREKKRYVLYVCGTQDQADDHVANIADLLTSPAFAQDYPALSERDLGKYGASAGWRRNRLRTRAGFTVDAIGLDVAARGRKLEADRPDLIVFDDLDDAEDSERVTEKKIRSLTRKLLPAGAADLAVIAVQNLVHPDSIFAQLSDGRAKFLADRIVSGPIPAIEDLVYEEKDGRFTLLSGRETWEGMDFERCQAIADDEGPDAFLVERQNRIDLFGETIFHPEWFMRYTPEEAPYMWNGAYRRFAGIDTAETEGRTSAYSALVVSDVQPNYQAPIRYVSRKKLEFPELVDWTVEELLPFYHDGKLEAVFIENASSGRQLIQTLRTSGPGWLAHRVVAVPPNPGPNGKEKGWKNAAYWARRQMTPLPTDAPWLSDFEKELFRVPNSTFKDQADAYSVLVSGIERHTGAFSERWHRLMNQQVSAGAMSA